jgi:hypothetical protein
MTKCDQLPPASRDIVVYAQGPTCCAVCALCSADRTAVEREVGKHNFGGAPVGWEASNMPFPDGAPNPRPCPHDAQRRHWLLLRVR